MEEPMQADKRAKPRGGRIRRELLSWVRLILISLVLAFLISNFVVVNAVVPTGSMENTIQVSDRIMAFRLTYLFEDPPGETSSFSNRPTGTRTGTSNGSSACRETRWRFTTAAFTSTARGCRRTM